MKHFSVFNLLVAGLVLAALTLSSLGGATAEASSYADNAFQQVWQQADAPIANGQASRSWLWGQAGWAGYENYNEAKAGGQRLVQYFDKSRMEINDPNANRSSQWFVSNGLLTMELVSGRLQAG